MKFIVFAALSLLLPFHSCSSRKDMGQNQKPEGHFRLYTYPLEVQEYLIQSDDSERFHDVVFAAFNDLGDEPGPVVHTAHDPAQKADFEMKVGGIAGMKSYLRLLKETFPRVQAVTSGSFLSPQAQPEETLFYLNYLGLDAAGLSQGEFSLPLRGNYVKQLDKTLKKAAFPVLASNMFDLEEGSEMEFANIKKTALVDAGGVGIGYISLISPSMAQAFDQEKMNKVYFQPMASKIITLSNELRKKGADIIALMVSHGVDCTSQIAQSEKVDEKKVNFAPKDDSVCDLYKNDLVQTLQKLPPDMVDIVFTNGADSKAANFIAGHPTLQNFKGGRHLAWAKLTYDKKYKRVAKEKTQILQPVQLCHSFFKETEDCYAKETLRNVEIVPAKFLGKEVEIQELPIRK